MFTDFRAKLAKWIDPSPGAIAKSNDISENELAAITNQINTLDESLKKLRGELAFDRSAVMTRRVTIFNLIAMLFLTFCITGVAVIAYRRDRGDLIAYLAYVAPIMAGAVAGMGLYFDRAGSDKPRERLFKPEVVFYQMSVLLLAIGMISFTYQMEIFEDVFSNMLGPLGLMLTILLLISNGFKVFGKSGWVDHLVSPLLWLMLIFGGVIAGAWIYLLNSGDVRWAIEGLASQFGLH